MGWRMVRDGIYYAVALAAGGGVVAYLAGRLFVAQFLNPGGRKASQLM